MRERGNIARHFLLKVEKWLQVAGSTSNLRQDFSQSEEDTRATSVGGRDKRLGKGERKSKLKGTMANGTGKGTRKGNGKGKSNVVRKGKKHSKVQFGKRQAKFGAKSKMERKGEKRRINGQLGGNRKESGRRISQPGFLYPKKTAAHHIEDPSLVELADLQQFRRNILAKLDVVKADVNNIVAIAQSKKQVAETATDLDKH